MSIFGASNTVVVAQLVRALDCGSRGRGFEPHHPPETVPDSGTVFLFNKVPLLSGNICSHRKPFESYPLAADVFLNRLNSIDWGQCVETSFFSEAIFGSYIL